MSMNFREWRHFFRLRAVGESGRPHPQMKEVACLLLKEMQNIFPVIFEDLKVK